MRTLLVVLALTLAGCGSSPTEPAASCRPMPVCEAFKNDIVRDSLKPLPSIDPSAKADFVRDSLKPLPTQ
jgi:hypothetical protein